MYPLFSVKWMGDRWEISTKNPMSTYEADGKIFLIRQVEKQILYREGGGLDLLERYLPNILLRDSSIYTDPTARIPMIYDKDMQRLTDYSGHGYHIPGNSRIHITRNTFVYGGRRWAPTSTYGGEINILSKILIERLRDTLSLYQGIEPIYLFYSGGVDSTLILLVGYEAGLRIIPTTIALPGSKDYLGAEETLKLLKLETDNILITPKEDDISEAMEEIFKIFPHISKVLVPVAITEYLLFKEVPRGSIVAMGQGADELFGGYDKYRRLYPDFETENIIDLTLLQYTTGYIEWVLSTSRGSIVIYPYLTPVAAEIGYSTPREYKVRSREDRHRKWVIREALKMLGAPKKVYMRMKKAMQYSTGISKYLKRIGR